MESKETPIIKSFLGLVKRGTCPICNTSLSKRPGTSVVLCSNCGDYLKFGDKTIRQFDPTAISPMPGFAAPTPWPDMQCPTYGAIPLTAANFVTDALLTKKEGVRMLDARWPAGCCVCGKPATRTETLTQHVGFAPPNGLKPRKNMEATVVAHGVPHCDEHEHGARFHTVISFGDIDVSILGLFFRSYPYQIQFRKLNSWKWLE